jgi:hypothetical protein
MKYKLMGSLALLGISLFVGQIGNLPYGAQAQTNGYTLTWSTVDNGGAARVAYAGLPLMARLHDGIISAALHLCRAARRNTCVSPPHSHSSFRHHAPPPVDNPC